MLQYIHLPSRCIRRFQRSVFDDVLLMLDVEALEIQIVHGVRPLAAPQLAQVHDGAAYGDDAVDVVVTAYR